MKVVRGIFLCCIIGGFAALFFVLSPSSKPLGSGEESGGIETEEDILVEGLQFYEWQEDRLTWSMSAERTRYHHKEKKASLEKVEVTFYPARGGKMLLRAEIVDYDLQTKDLLARMEMEG